MLLQEFEILYEEEYCLAVNKPAGLLTQAPRGIDSLEWRVKKYLTGHSEYYENIYLGIPHRLDRPVSGVILFGKNSRATHQLSKQFEERQIEKTYRAVVEGNVTEDNGTWIDYIRKIPNKPLAEIIAPIHPDAREAVLHYTVLKRFVFLEKNFTHLEIKLETGRMHQIRLQSSVHGHSILGDVDYGSIIPFGNHFADGRCREIALHAYSITFLAPMTRNLIHLTAPLPPVWNPLLPILFGND